MTDARDERSRLTDELGVDIDPELLSLALTHRSYAYEHGQIPHNERLEFLGDSVLGQAVTVTLYTRHPDLDEGTLAKRRASVVSTVALAEVARRVGLGEHLLLGRGEELTGGRDKDSILADTTEALIGATYLSHGQDAATRLVLRLVEPLLADPARFGAAVDPKTSLQELAGELDRPAPVYSVVATGPDHARTFTATVTVGDLSASGAGRARSRRRWPRPSARGTSSADVPELPEVEVVRAGLEPALRGARIQAVEVRDARALTRHPGSADGFVADLIGREVSAVVRRGKFLWMPLQGSDERAIVAHLGMSGQLLVREPAVAAERHERIRVFIDHPVHGELAIVFADQRTFGSLAIDRLVATPDGAPGGRGDERPATPLMVAHIARDALDPAFDEARWRAALARKDSAIKRVLLDQTVLSASATSMPTSRCGRRGSIRRHRPGYSLRVL